ncbi:MAG: sialidase family protein [Verrucomicrobiota bacterium]
MIGQSGERWGPSGRATPSGEAPWSGLKKGRAKDAKRVEVKAEKFSFAAFAAFARKWKTKNRIDRETKTKNIKRNQNMKKLWGKLMVIGAGLLLSGVAQAQEWIQTSAPAKSWTSVVSSADGSKLIATANSWTYYTSTNSGFTWTSNREPQSGSLMGSWYAVASSADGNKLAALQLNTVFTSTNAGISWTSNNVPGGTNLISIASSADGAKLVVAVGLTPSFNFAWQRGFIYTSTDSGATWTQSGAPNKYWSSVASSADGTKLVAAAMDDSANAGWIYTSTNSGFTWTQTSAPTNSYWVSVASSADGSKLAAVNFPAYTFIGGNLVFTALGLVYISTNSGATWVSNNVPNNTWPVVSEFVTSKRGINTLQG